MGRYYYGDIEGKFWFGVQSSDAADQFGSIGEYDDENCIIHYTFTSDHAYTVRKRLRELKAKLGKNLELFDNFFNNRSSYCDQDLETVIGPDTNKLLRIYADYLLGKQIRKALKYYGECSFTAEC